MAKRGPKPLTNDADERRWLTRIRKMTERLGPVDVYCCADRHGVHVRKAVNEKSPRRLPADCVHLGRFQSPLPRADMLEDIRAAMRQMVRP